VVIFLATTLTGGLVGAMLYFIGILLWTITLLPLLFIALLFDIIRNKKSEEVKTEEQNKK
jgi:hypothetical protein